MTLTNKDKEDIFLLALCDGWHTFEQSGVTIDFSEAKYKTTADIIKNKGISPCYEDVVMQMLIDGFSISCIDDDDEESYLNTTITIQDVYDGIDLVPDNIIQDILDENYDANHADTVLQFVFFKTLIFG